MRTTIREISVEKSSGRFYTPDYIVKNILDLSCYYGYEILQKHTIDNSCGDGAFLCEIVRRYCQAGISKGLSKDCISTELSTYIHGIEINKEECLKCIQKLTTVAAEYGINNVCWDVICADALQINKYDNMMDFVLGNPPYIRIHNLSKIYTNIKNFEFVQKGMSDLYIVFYEIGIKMLNENGILGYITPSSFFNSVAGNHLRKVLVQKNLISKIVDLMHFQAFDATTYTTIVILKNNNTKREIDFYKFNNKTLKPYFINSLSSNNFYISGNFYFSEKENLKKLKKILLNLGHCDVEVKNGYATLCDSVFINDFKFQSKFIIPVIKSSTGAKQKIFYPYDTNSQPILEEDLVKDSKMYSYLLSNKERLLKRDNKDNADKYWYCFGRRQAINDTYKEKMTINSLLRDENDFKFVHAPSGVGVYGGIYIISKTKSLFDIKELLMSKEFVNYISLLGKYKSGGYYTFSSKDVKAFLDYKLSYYGGLFSDEE